MELFSIGEFSRMSGLAVKTLRFYHEKQLLVPAWVEGATGYRHYDDRNLERARVIVALRRLDFGLDAIAEILEQAGDEGDVLGFLERQRGRLREEIRHREGIVHILDSIIAAEREVKRLMQNDTYDVEVKSVEPILIGGIRTKGRYRECGELFSRLGRKLGRHIAGSAMMLCYDQEYREEDADFEPCMPLRKVVDVEEVDVRELPGGRCLSLVHAGPYEELSRSYGRLLRYAKEHGHEVELPSREVYLKGPGMIFKGNPKKYRTELQFMLKP